VKKYLGGYKMKFRKNVKKLKVFKFLLSKLVYDEKDGLHLDEYLVLMELWFEFLEKSDPSFLEKYGASLQRSLNFYSQVAAVKEFPMKLATMEPNELLDIHYGFGDLLLSRHGYFGMKGNRDIRDSFRISFEDQFAPLRLPPQRYIGVGYRDKGNAKKSSEDGNQRWQEIASVSSQLESAVISTRLDSLTIVSPELPSLDEKSGRS
jgi:hypothetical protein